MDASLVKLLLLRLRGGIRQRLLEFKTVRGWLFLLVTVVFAILFLKQSAMPATPLASFFSGGSEPLKEHMARFMPSGLLAAFLLTAFISPNPALYFSPTEINLLFSGPFTRRALILYKLSFYAFGALLSSFLIMLLVPKAIYTPPAVFFGTFLTMMFIQLNTIATKLAVVFVRKRFFLRTPFGYSFMMMILFLAAAAGYFAFATYGPTGAIARFQSSLFGTLVLAPFAVFAQIFLANAIYPGVLAWSSLGLAINIGILALVIRLDGYSFENSTAASLKLYKNWDRARRSGLPWGAQPTVVHSFTRPPKLGGIGPIVWRQLLTAVRCSGKALLLFLAMTALTGPILAIAGPNISTWSLIGGLFFAAVFVLPKTLVFDFRSDLEMMENFKALPLSPWKITLGQLAAPVLLSSLLEGILLVSIAIMHDDAQAPVFLIGISLFLLPFNLLLYGLENLFFLLFPAPLVPVGRADFDFLGRTLLGFAVTATILLGNCFLAAYAGQIAMNISGLAWPAFIVAAWLSFTLIALLILPMLSVAFNRFNVSRG